VASDLKNKMFDPSYINKDGGTGIGLYITERIIRDHGGSFAVFDSKWDGAEFRIEIPTNRGTDQT
jgi:nitrogen-specific signal transduction histidine kinase